MTAINKPYRGFTMVEIAIAMFVLAVFLLPLMQHFVRTRRVSLAARDAVIVNSYQASCLGELSLLDYDDLASSSGATFTRVIKKYTGEKVVNNLSIQTSINISSSTEARMLTIDVKSRFRFPGSTDQKSMRNVGMRGYVFPKP
jgi:prepilin-type N-terminal cleavage/methylation domain-containing protein